MKELFNSILFVPLYNALVFLIDIVPGGDLGLAVIILTIIVKLVLFPLSIKAVKTQMKMKELQGEMDLLKEKYKEKKEELGKELLEFYKRNELNPFSGIVVVLIQLPVILALYYVFLSGGFPEINKEILYSFVSIPDSINLHFLGFFNMTTANSLVLALLTGITQHIQARFSLPKTEPKKTDKPSFQDDLARSMNVQVKYILPVVIAVISYSLVSVVSLYWIISNLFAIGQELYMRKKIRVGK